MAMALPRPSDIGCRPAYLDNLFAHSASPRSPQYRHDIAYNVTPALDLDKALPLAPAFEPADDTRSVRSLRLRMSPSRFHLQTILHRRTYPQPSETISMDSTSSTTSPKSTPGQSLAGSRRPSLARLPMLSPPSRKDSLQPKLQVKTSHLDLARPAQELSCHRCYYFAARNCNGWVMGGSHGDACESCAVSRSTTTLFMTMTDSPPASRFPGITMKGAVFVCL